ncbi:serine protease [Plantactinospora sp. KBS50]|nr:serine protease [Plantactinospora sp. KBS50]
MAVEDLPPWRRGRRAQFPGLPAWSMPAAASQNETFDVSAFPEITPEWAWGGADGCGVRVAIVDSGVDGGHELCAPIATAWRVGTDEAGLPRMEECPPVDRAGHGTACASIVRGLAPAAEISSVQVLTDGKFGSGAALLAGLEHTIDQGFDVINMSLSTTRPEFRTRLTDLADRAYFRRCVLVVSAHNLPVESYPWNFSSVISVASHDESDPKTYYYNPAPPVDFHARGARVPVARPGGGIVRSTGNSFAAPHLTGMAALVLSKHPRLTPFQLKSVLFHCAANVTRLGGSAHVAESRG